MRDTGTPLGAPAAYPRLPRGFSVAVFVLFVLVSMVVLFTPAPEVPRGPEGIDKVIHLALFAAMAVSGRYAGVPARVLVPALVAYGGVSELLQGLPAIDRSTSAADWAADTVGVAVGFGARYVGAVLRTRRRSASRSSSGWG
jgi:VanZ family protein